MSSLTPLALVRRIEYILLDPLIGRAEIEAGCAAAIESSAYSVITKPHYVEVCRKLVKEVGIKTASVVGFPHGGSSTATKMYETQDIIQRGVDEVAMSINLGALRDHDDLLVHNDIAVVVRTARSRPVTVIIEMGVMTNEELKRACKIADAAGAACVQTSSGFAAPKLSSEDIRALRMVCGRLQIKALCSVRSYKTALEMIEAGALRVLIPHF